MSVTPTPTPKTPTAIAAADTTGPPRPTDDLAQAQRELRRAAGELRVIGDRLAQIAGALPEHPQRDTMFESLRPPDVATEIFSIIETVDSEYLLPASAALDRGATATNEGIAQAYARTQQSLGGPLRPPPTES